MPGTRSKTANAARNKEDAEGAGRPAEQEKEETTYERIYRKMMEKRKADAEAKATKKAVPAKKRKLAAKTKS